MRENFAAEPSITQHITSASTEPTVNLNWTRTLTSLICKPLSRVELTVTATKFTSSSVKIYVHKNVNRSITIDTFHKVSKCKLH